MNIFLKKDYMQYTGSFKERGARYTLVMMSEEEKRRGVISASAGNHALGLAYHGQQLGTFLDKVCETFLFRSQKALSYFFCFRSGIPVTVVMPVTAPIMKVENCKKMGAKVVIYGSNFGEAKKRALAIGHRKKLLYING